MNVLVTGASGFSGRPLVHRLLAQGHRLRALLRRAHEDHVLDLISAAPVDGTAARGDFSARWTPLEAGPQGLARAV